MNTSQLGSILNRMFALDGPQRRAFSDQGRRRPPRPLKRSLRRGIITPIVSRPIQPSTGYPAEEDSIVDLTSSGSSLNSRPYSYPSTSATAGTKKKRPRSLYTPERVKRNSVYDKNTSLATTTKTIMTA